MVVPKFMQEVVVGVGLFLGMLIGLRDLAEGQFAEGVTPVEIVLSWCGEEVVA